MATFLSLLLIFLYFKIARVHKKEEKLHKGILLQHLIIAIASVILFKQAFMTHTWYVVGIEAFLAFIAAALMVTVVQLGIFVDGKPLFGLKFLYRNLYLLTGAIILAALSVFFRGSF